KEQHHVQPEMSEREHGGDPFGAIGRRGSIGLDPVAEQHHLIFTKKNSPPPAIAPSSRARGGATNKINGAPRPVRSRPAPMCRVPVARTARAPSIGAMLNLLNRKISGSRRSSSAAPE